MTLLDRQGKASRNSPLAREQSKKRGSMQDRDDRVYEKKKTMIRGERVGSFFYGGAKQSRTIDQETVE